MIQNSSKLKIRKLAETIALSFDEKITPLDKIIYEEELKVHYDDYEQGTFDGMTIFENNKFSIHINTADGNTINSPRGRYTLAHELGHYIIDSHRIALELGFLEPFPSKTNQKDHNSIEREADYFASCLLMPEIRYQKDIVGKKFDFDLIKFLSKEYNVSISACAIRFAQIGNHPIMIIYAENGLIKWTYSSDDFRYKTIINYPRVSEHFLMGEYFANSDKVSKTAQIWAVECFDYIKDEDLNTVFYEHCISHNNSALSIIWYD